MNQKGRPKIPKSKSKSEFLNKIRVSASEKAKYEKKAEQEGLSFSEWVRNALEKACD